MMEQEASAQPAGKPTAVKGWWIVAAIVAAVLLLGVLPWRLTGQHINLVVVNESGRPVEFTWQPGLFLEKVSVTRNGCESSSMDLQAGLEWTLTGDEGGVILDSAGVDVPFFTPRLAVEVRLNEQGGVTIAPARAVSAPLDAPYPACVGETAAED